jgi:hypothetical protein
LKKAVRKKSDWNQDKQWSAGRTLVGLKDDITSLTLEVLGMLTPRVRVMFNDGAPAGSSISIGVEVIFLYLVYSPPGFML